MSSTLRDTILAHRSRRTEPITEDPVSEPARRQSQASDAPTKKGRGGKSSDPRYQKVGIFVLRESIEAIQRYQIGKKEDLSDFVERALDSEIKRTLPSNGRVLH